MSPTSEQKYTLLKQMYDDKPTEEKFRKLIKALRDSVGFHYMTEDVVKGTDCITKSLHKMADTNTLAVNSIIEGTEVHSSRFVLADAAIIHAICDFIWEVQKDKPADTEQAIDDICAWCAKQSNALYGFGRELCNLYFAEYNAL